MNIPPQKEYTSSKGTYSGCTAAAAAAADADADADAATDAAATDAASGTPPGKHSCTAGEGVCVTGCMDNRCCISIPSFACELLERV